MQKLYISHVLSDGKNEKYAHLFRSETCRWTLLNGFRYDFPHPAMLFPLCPDDFSILFSFFFPFARVLWQSWCALLTRQRQSTRVLIDGPHGMFEHLSTRPNVCLMVCLFALLFTVTFVEWRPLTAKPNESNGLNFNCIS